MAHDFRRTAVRNLERAGVSPFIRRDAMLGHRTESIYNRSTEYESASETQQALLGGDLGNSVRGHSSPRLYLCLRRQAGSSEDSRQGAEAFIRYGQKNQTKSGRQGRCGEQTAQRRSPVEPVHHGDRH
jgi:hypothetical protein